jgi:hypothetical protein
LITSNSGYPYLIFEKDLFYHRSRNSQENEDQGKPSFSCPEELNLFYKMETIYSAENVSISSGVVHDGYAKEIVQGQVRKLNIVIVPRV